METVVKYEFFCSMLGPGMYAYVGEGWPKHIQGYVTIWLTKDPHISHQFHAHSN